jgi:hypothetical protein
MDEQQPGFRKMRCSGAADTGIAGLPGTRIGTSADPAARAGELFATVKEMRK